MALVITRPLRATQPQGGDVDRSKAVCAGLKRVILHYSPNCLVSGSPITYGTSITKKALSNGIGLHTENSAGSYITMPGWTDVTGEASIMLFQVRDDTTDNGWIDASFTPTLAAHFPYANLVYASIFTNSRWISAASIPSGKSFTEPHIIIATCKNGNQNSYWDGTPWVSNTIGEFGIPTTFRILGSTFSSWDHGFGGSLFLCVIWERILSLPEIISLSANPWQIFKTRGRLSYADLVGGVITLSGAAITSAEGAVASANTITVSGINSTGSQGATTPSILSPLSGGLLTESGGSLAPTADVTPAGILYTAYYGSTTPANTTAISGSSATASNGSVSAEAVIALVGAAATSYYGIVTAQADGSITLSGIAMTSAAGATTADLSVSTAGQQASHAQGSVIPVSVISLSGDVQTVSVGAVSPALSAALSGLSAALARGTVTPVADGVITLVGMDILTQEGALSTVVDKSLSGNSVTLTKGDVGYEFLYSLIGSSLTGSVGTFAVNRDGAITGTTATTAYENLTALLSQGLTGWQIDSAQDSLSVDRTKAISGSQITSAPGTVAFTLRDITLTLTGVAITAQYGHLAIDGAVLIDAGNQTVLICEKGTSVFLVEKVSVMIM